MTNDTIFNHTPGTEHETSHEPTNAGHSDTGHTHGSPSTHDEHPKHHEADATETSAKETKMKQTNLKKIAGLILAASITLFGSATNSAQASTNVTRNSTGAVETSYAANSDTRAETAINLVDENSANSLKPTVNRVTTRTGSCSRATNGYETSDRYFTENASPGITTNYNTNLTVETLTADSTFAGGTVQALITRTVAPTATFTANETLAS